MTTDREFANRLASGDQAALGELYDRLAGRVFGLAVSMLGDRSDAEEVVSDTFLQVWRSAADFTERRGSLDAWVIAITRSRALDRIRGTRRRDRLRTEGEHKIASFTAGDAGPDPALFAETRLTMRRTVGPALMGLAEDQRRVIELAYLGGMTQSEIAEALELPLGTVKTRLRVGMQALRTALGAGETELAGSTAPGVEDAGEGQ